MWNYLKEINRPILLYGMGNGADKILDEMERRGIAASGVLPATDLPATTFFAALK